MKWAAGRPSRSRSRCAVANELILVVEDNDKNRKLVRDVLTFKGYEIIEAETGEEGVRLAQERHPSLVLMDIRLPGIDGIDGIEALRRLRAEPATRGIPVMAMTASVMTADRQRITDAGFDAYQSKPIKVKDFVAWNGYLLTVACPCGVVLERWVTTEDAEADLLSWASLN